MSKALNSYGQRWKIEQLHRQIKQDYRWEAIQLMSYTGLKNMNLLLLLAMCFLYSLKRIAMHLMQAFPHIMKYSNRKWKQIYDFVYYRIANLLDICLGYISKYNITTFKRLKKDNDQTYIIIGHNIGFDINFLEKFFPGIEYATSIDTYRLSQALVHYAPSYALEVLMQHLSTKEPSFLPLLTSFTGEAHSSDKSHDALYDTKESLALFVFLAQTIEQTQENYPAFARIRQQSEGTFAKIFPAQDVVKTTIQFPSLSKIAPGHISLEKDTQEINRENQKRYYIGNSSIKAILSHLAGNKECILVFQNIQKLDIAKKILNDIGIKNI
jgi:hypothetical protein